MNYTILQILRSSLLLYYTINEWTEARLQVTLRLQLDVLYRLWSGRMQRKHAETGARWPAVISHVQLAEP